MDNPEPQSKSRPKAGIHSAQFAAKANVSLSSFPRTQNEWVIVQHIFSLSALCLVFCAMNLRCNTESHSILFVAIDIIVKVLIFIPPQTRGN